MTLIELIGFIITMAAFFILVAKQVRDERKRRQNPEAYEEEEEREHQQAVKDLLRSLNIDVPEDEPPSTKAKNVPKPVPPPAPVENKEIVKPKMIGTPIQKQKGLFRDPYALRKTFEHGDAYAKRVEQRSRIQQVLKGSDSLKQAVILKEVLGTPKGLE